MNTLLRSVLRRLQDALVLSLVTVFATRIHAGEPVREEWTIDGVVREALVCLPTRTMEGGAPVVFGFHGHGGSMRNAARSFRLHELWPEAIVVYMQGLPTPGRLTDPEGKRAGWQHGPKDHGDRDLKFFDAVLKTQRETHHINQDRVYATGHSNGGAFTYLLWAERPDLLAAVAPSATASLSVLSLTPKPAMHIAGQNDRLVRFALQQRVMGLVRRINKCQERGEEWAEGCTLYPSANGTPFVAFIHVGNHKFPAEAPALIVRFFKEHTRRHGRHGLTSAVCMRS
jgi:polyhydroxybutyrate depolymerase